jgi:hypothetical protein
MKTNQTFVLLDAIAQAQVALADHVGGVLDHLVGAAKERDQESEAERLRGLHVDDQLDPGGLLHWQAGQLLVFENPAGVVPNKTGPDKLVAGRLPIRIA